MKTIRIILLLVVALFVAYEKYVDVTPEVAGREHVGTVQSRVDSEDEGAVPAKALRVLQIVRNTGQPPEGYVGGRVFQNREGRLPEEGEYREFDIDPHHGGRNAERIIVEWRTKKAWYTGDHYRTFIPLP